MSFFWVCNEHSATLVVYAEADWDYKSAITGTGIVIAACIMPPQSSSIPAQSAICDCNTDTQIPELSKAKSNSITTLIR